MTKHLENAKNATCDNNVLANRLLKFRVYYELDNELRFWHVEFKQEEKRLSIPQVSTNGRILGVVQFTGILDKNGEEIYEGDIVRRVFFDSDEIPSTHIGIIKWDNGNYYSHSIENELSRGFCEMKGVSYEILGNVFETKQPYKFR